MILRYGRRKLLSSALATGLLGLLASTLVFAQETLPPLEEGKVPQNIDELWSDFDPAAEPLDIEILKEWEEEGVILKVLRYRVGVFKGKKSMMAAVYGYPKNGENLPGLVQVHGGGQFADARAVLANAKRGYATISLSWAGRISAPDYTVNRDIVKLFWDNKTDNPKYLQTTDWGALDGYHAGSRSGKDFFTKIPEGDEWTLDPFASPRNSSWFLATMAARRALTFLEKQPQVDPERLGIYGHSMGGKITVLTTGVDKRVKAAAPSCGGISDRYHADPLFERTIGDLPYLKRITAPIIFLSPANDFHGRINDLQNAVTEIQTDTWRITCAPHHDHQDTAPYEVATQVWFDNILKGPFQVPKTPKTRLKLATDNGVPLFTVYPDHSKPIASVEIYYTEHGQEGKGDRANTSARYWHLAEAKKADGAWIAELPLLSIDEPLWVYANVHYRMDEPIAAAGYYYRDYETTLFNLSSLMKMISPEKLKDSGVKATMKKSRLIEDFQGDWKKQWFSYRPEHWPISTHKVYSKKWEAPKSAKLAVKIRSEEANSLVIRIDDYAASVPLKGGSEAEEFQLSAANFKNAQGEELKNFEGIRTLQLTDKHSFKGKKGEKQKEIGGKWNGPEPIFKELRWMAPEETH